MCAKCGKYCVESRFECFLWEPFFSTVFRIPLDLHFGAIWEGAGRHYTPSGVPLASFGNPLRAWVPVGLTGPSLGALWDSLRGFGWVLSSRCEVAKVCVFWSTWAPPGRHYTASGGSFALAKLPLGFPGPPLTPFWVSPGALWVRSRCFFVFLGNLSMSALFLCYLGWGAMCNPYTPVHVL